MTRKYSEGAGKRKWEAMYEASNENAHQDGICDPVQAVW